MDLLVLIFGIIGWIYNCLPLLITTLIISICGLLLEGIFLKKDEGSYIGLLIFTAGIAAPLVRMLQ